MIIDSMEMSETLSKGLRSCNVRSTQAEVRIKHKISIGFIFFYEKNVEQTEVLREIGVKIHAETQQ